MKKILFLILLLIPFVVNADNSGITIESVELVEQIGTSGVYSNEEHGSDNIDFNIRFNNLEDSVKYKIVIHNGTKDDYEIPEGTVASSNKAFGFNTELTEDVSVFKSGEDITMLLTINYDEELDDTGFVNGVFTETNTASITFINQSSNPLTSKGTIVATAIIVMLISFAGIAIFTRRYKSLSIIILAIAFVPIVTNALKKYSININANIKVYKTEECIFRTDRGSFSQTEDIKEITATITHENIEYKGIRDYSYDYEVEDDPDDYVRKLFFDAPYTKEEFSNDSYIRIYEDSTKENMLYEVTKDYYPPDFYSITNDLFTTNIGIKIELGFYDYRNIYVEASQDLMDIHKEAWSYNGSNRSRVFMTPIKYRIEWLPSKVDVNEISYYEYVSPRVYNPEEIELFRTIHTNRGPYSATTDLLIGFDREDNPETCVYHARWSLYVNIL